MKTHKDQNPDDVSAALRLLAESLEEEEKCIRSEGSKAMNEGDYDTATAVIDFAKRLLAFQKKVAGLEKEWDDLEDLRDKATPAVQEIVSKASSAAASAATLPHRTITAPRSSECSPRWAAAARPRM